MRTKPIISPSAMFYDKNEVFELGEREPWRPILLERINELPQYVLTLVERFFKTNA